MFEDDARIPIFTGGFLWGLSFLVAIIGMFFLKAVDPNNPDFESDHLEIIIGVIGANVLGLMIAFRFYSESTYGGMSSDTEGDSAVAFVAGLAIALYALLATWLYLADTPVIVITFGMSAAAMAFIGIVLVFFYWGSSSPY
ncbi:MAG: hypothetical protein ACXAC7_23505 [Candidatus Hodarchaeales archaeon]|jgi:hypothetical protein